jgi:hypothetical protein
MSKIEVNKIGPQCGTTLTVGCGAGQTVTVDANTVTIGRCGGTVALASGATQSGFGRTGTVDWNTTPKTTGTFSAVSGDGFFLNTSGGVITANLPAGVAGAIVSFADYAGTWQTNNVTVTPNGTDKIGSVNNSVILNTEGQSVTFVFVDSTQGWINTMDSTSNVRGNAHIAATGGTESNCGNFKIHTFTGPGTFTVTNAGAGTPDAPALVDYLVVAGGGGGGGGEGTGGGGAGGYRESPGTASGSYTVSPRGAAPAVSLPVSVQAYPITVGGGGTPGNPCGAGTPCGVGGSGAVSTFSTITSTGGGGGGGGGGYPGLATNGGSGGGGGGRRSASGLGGSGNTPPVNPAQGTDGGDSGSSSSPTCIDAGGGGGGALVAGSDGVSGSTGGAGGGGATSSINGSPTARAGGGGGGAQIGPPGGPPGNPGAGGAGGGAAGGTGANGSTNTGGGGGGFSHPGGAGGTGGSGIVIIRYKFQ